MPCRLSPTPNNVPPEIPLPESTLLRNYGIEARSSTTRHKAWHTHTHSHTMALNREVNSQPLHLFFISEALQVLAGPCCARLAAWESKEHVSAYPPALWKVGAQSPSLDLVADPSTSSLTLRALPLNSSGKCQASGSCRHQARPRYTGCYK